MISYMIIILNILLVGDLISTVSGFFLRRKCMICLSNVLEFWKLIKSYIFSMKIPWTCDEK